MLIGFNILVDRSVCKDFSGSVDRRVFYLVNREVLLLNLEDAVTLQWILSLLSNITE